MTETQFLQLCRDTSVALGEADADVLGRTGEIRIDDIPIGLYFDEKKSPYTIFCYVDIGEIDQSLRPHVHEQLLTRNLLSGVKTNGVYALDPLTGNALFVVHLHDPEELPAAELARALRLYAMQANSLRRDLLRAAPVAPAFSPQAAGSPMFDLA
jgi:hypothetical protein